MYIRQIAIYNNIRTYRLDLRTDISILVDEAEAEQSRVSKGIQMTT